jgi:hypothetical protein
LLTVDRYDGGRDKYDGGDKYNGGYDKYGHDRGEHREEPLDGAGSGNAS